MKKALIILLFAVVLTGCTKKDATKDATTPPVEKTQDPNEVIPVTGPGEDSNQNKEANDDNNTNEEIANQEELTRLKIELNSKNQEVNSLRAEINKLNKQLADKSTSTQTPSTTAKKFYHVVVGAFSKLENANNQKQILAAKGYESYVVKSGKYYRVIAGSFTQLKNAKSQKDAILNAGYDCFILPSS